VIKRLHPRISLTRTLTGRLATTGFPVLGLPKHSAEGRRIRSLVRAPSGFAIAECDYSQIELRAAADLSGDEGMIGVFQRGEDLHALTAHKVLGAPPRKEDQDESTHRLPAKAANFGYWMGLGAKGLTEQVHKAGNLTWSQNCPGCKWFKAEHDPDCDSQRFFAVFNEQFPGAPAYQLDRMERAEQTGFAYGMWGARWYLPGVWSPDEMTAAATKRQAFALPIQEGAQRLIKQAMGAIWKKDLPWATQQHAIVEPLLQVHDSLLFCVEAGFALPWLARVRETMETVAVWKVPIVAAAAFGPSWLEQTKVKA
jgi:DNA polymerase-1